MEFFCGLVEATQDDLVLPHKLGTEVSDPLHSVNARLNLVEECAFTLL
jgi:hypothetical protein